MKHSKHIVIVAILFMITSCAALTRNVDTVKRDEFLNKFPLLNNEILGELKYDDPKLDLRTLGLDDYTVLFDRIDLTADSERTVKFIKDNTSQMKFVVLQDTFVICLRADAYELALCDDAATPKPAPDKVRTGTPLPDLETLYGELDTK